MAGWMDVINDVGKYVHPRESMPKADAQKQTSLQHHCHHVFSQTIEGRVCLLPKLRSLAGPKITTWCHSRGLGLLEPLGSQLENHAEKTQRCII